MENSFYQELLTALQSSFSGKSTEEIKNAEIKLKQYEDKALDILPSLQQVIGSNEISLQMKKALINYINKVIISGLKKNSFEKEKIISIIGTLVTFLFSSESMIDENIISLICIGLNECCSDIQISNDTSATIDILKAINAQFTHKTSIALSLYQMIIMSKCCNEMTIGSMQEIVIKSIYMLFTSQIDITNLNQCIGIRKGLDLFMLLMKQLSNLRLLPVYFADYINALSPLMLSLIQAYTIDDNIVTFIQKDAKENEIQAVLELNTLKAKCLCIIASFIQLSNKDKIDNEVLLTVLTKLLPAIFSSLRGITQNNKKRTHVSSQKNLKATGYESLIYQALFVISRCIARDPFYLEFQPNCFNMIFTILFQFLCTTKSDKIELKENFESYYTAMIDAMYDFKLKNIKTVAGFLLSFMCDKFESLALKVLAFVFQLLTYDMNELDSRGIGKYPLINNELGLQIVEGFPVELQIDNSLFFMCILAKHTLKNKEIRMKLKEFLIINQSRLHDTTSVLIKYKICLIYGLCLDELFTLKDVDMDANTDTYQFIYKSIEFLLNLIFNFDSDPSLSFQALHSLEGFIPLDGFKQICNIIVRKQMDKIINSILTIKIDIFFDVLSTMVVLLDLEEWMLKICQLTVQRFQSDIIDSHYSKNTFVIKELRVIKEIIDKVEYNSEIEQAIIPIISHLQTNSNSNKNALTLTDDITAILLSIAHSNKNNNALQPILLKAFPCYMTILQSDNGMSANLFQLLNHIIINDKDNAIHQNKELSQLFNKLIQTSFSYINEYLGDSPSPLFTLLLIQIWLMNKNNRTDTSNIYQCISSICVNFNDIAQLYINHTHELGKLYDLYMIWLYLSVIYSSLFNHSNITLDVIYNMNIIDKIIVYTDQLTQCSFFPCKLVKFFILGICKLLTTKESLIKIFTSVGAFMRILFKLIKKEYIEEVDKAKMKEMKELGIKHIVNDGNNAYGDGDDDEDEDEQEGKENNKIIQEQYYDRGDNEKVNKCIDLAIFDVNEDEFLLFNYTMTQLRNVNELKNELNEFENSISDEDKELLNNILDMRRISVQSNQQTTIPRKILNVKRRTNINQ